MSRAELLEKAGHFEVTSNYQHKDFPNAGVKRKAVIYNNTYQNVLHLMRLSHAEFIDLYKEHTTLKNKDQVLCKDTIKSNAQLLEACGYRRSDNSFSNGDYKDLFESPSPERMKEFTDLNFASQYQELCFERGETQTRRRRMRDAHEGEFDLSKQWDAEPFMRRKSTPVNTRTVKLNAHICFSGHTSSSEINRYGVFVAGLTNYLESLGIGVELVLKSYSTDTITSGGIADCGINILIKKPDVYLPAADLLQAFSGNFYRRAVFSFDIVCGIFSNTRISSGLGRPVQYGKTFEVDKDKGEINLYSVIKYGETSTDLIKNALDAFIGA